MIVILAHRNQIAESIDFDYANNQVPPINYTKK
jgi:hypothetical protein